MQSTKSAARTWERPNLPPPHEREAEREESQIYEEYQAAQRAKQAQPTEAVNHKQAA